MTFIPSVMTWIGEIPSRAIGIRGRQLESRPTRAPIARTSGIAQISGPFFPFANIVMRIAAPFSVQGIERSMPPPRITNVWPRATMPMNEAWIVRIRMWLALAKPVENAPRGGEEGDRSDVGEDIDVPGSRRDGGA